MQKFTDTLIYGVITCISKCKQWSAANGSPDNELIPLNHNTKGM